ncbi:MAG: type II toxin-antitoxin system VapC family toxin [Defluviitaleaceae bacterium]|nr:type II toxin-antitoxin system VapC family toxin [Defluviitaleaceae bacterium]
MGYLLDTHTMIWYFDRDVKLPARITEIIDNPENSIFICSASLWEIAIKVSINKLNLPFSELLNKVRVSRFSLLQPEIQYLSKVIELPQIHKDPFDRLLIAMALVEKMAILTADENIHRYDAVKWIW